MSPLTALMIDQQDRFHKLGISTEFISEECHDLDTIKGIKDGRYQVLFISPESLLCNPQWRNILLSNVYQENLVCVAVDEAHCIPKWYTVAAHYFHFIFQVKTLKTYLQMTMASLWSYPHKRYSHLEICGI